MDTGQYIADFFVLLFAFHKNDNDLLWLGLKWGPADIAGLLVALTTLCLAVITWRSVALTKNVVSSEDRRHQQDYAPLIEMTLNYDPQEGFISNFVLENIGSGIALKVRLEGTVSVRISVNDRRPLNADEIIMIKSFMNENRILPDRNFYVPNLGSIQPSGENSWTTDMIPDEEFSMNVKGSKTSITNDGRYALIPSDIHNDLLQRKTKEVQEIMLDIVIKYEDMFQNEYKTHYDKIEFSCGVAKYDYEFMRPSSLYSK
jgi:hypothetical protein